MEILQLELERVIGLTAATPSGLACNGISEELAYVAGCVVVIYNVKINCQTHFLTTHGSPKPFLCVAFSNQGGKFIAAGEVISSNDSFHSILAVILAKKFVLFKLSKLLGVLHAHDPLAQDNLFMSSLHILLTNCSQGTNQQL